MTDHSFQALYLERTDGSSDGSSFTASVKTLSQDALVAATPDADVLVDVHYSTINYKDALALTNAGPVVRRWPMVAGIDAVGQVIESTHARWATDDTVILNGWGAGETHWGGLAQRVRVKGDWLLALPSVFTEQQAMAIGTAGYTAALCVLTLESHRLTPGLGPVLVTGATGGVGSIAIALLNARGYEVTAASGKKDVEDYLKTLGAHAVIDRGTLTVPGKPLQTEQWAGVVDTLGSHSLANACAQTMRGHAVATCGLAQGMDFPATVAPFILRGISLLGVDSAQAPLTLRQAAWQLLAESLDTQKLDAITQVVPLAQSFEIARALIDGRMRGRVVVDVRR